MAGEDRCPSSSREQTSPPSPFLLYSGSQMIRGHLPTLMRAIFFSLLIQMVISSGNTLTDKPRHSILQLSGHPLAHSR